MTIEKRFKEWNQAKLKREVSKMSMFDCILLFHPRAMKYEQPNCSPALRKLIIERIWNTIPDSYKNYHRNHFLCVNKWLQL